MSSDLESYSGTGSETLLEEVLATITGLDDLKNIPDVLERFWGMFVVDAFIGNNDRNSDNSDCNKAVSRFVNVVDMNAIKHIIYSIPETAGTLSVMPETQKRFYLALMEMRLSKALIPAVVI